MRWQGGGILNTWYWQSGVPDTWYTRIMAGWRNSTININMMTTPVLQLFSCFRAFVSSLFFSLFRFCGFFCRRVVVALGHVAYDHGTCTGTTVSPWEDVMKKSV